MVGLLSAMTLRRDHAKIQAFLRRALLDFHSNPKQRRVLEYQEHLDVDAVCMDNHMIQLLHQCMLLGGWAPPPPPPSPPSLSTLLPHPGARLLPVPTTVQPPETGKHGTKTAVKPPDKLKGQGGSSSIHNKGKSKDAKANPSSSIKRKRAPEHAERAERHVQPRVPMHGIGNLASAEAAIDRARKLLS
jgi:hypothetical protein